MSLPLTRARRARIEPRASYVAMAIGSELITEVRVPYGLVDVVASYYAQEPVNRHIGFGRRSGRHLRKRSQ